MARSGRFVTVQSRGVLALPADVRARHGLDAPGAQVEVIEREDGVIELHPHIAVRADQAWFWFDRWQRMERYGTLSLPPGSAGRESTNVTRAWSRPTGPRGGPAC